MRREFLLLRSGKAYSATGLEDFQRPLKDRGKRNAQRMAVWLQQQGLVPNHIVSSPAERALVTAEKFPFPTPDSKELRDRPSYYYTQSSVKKWQERHRWREWVTPEQAAARLKQAELGPMVLSLAERLNKQ